LATNSSGMTYSLGNHGPGSWRVVSLCKNGASIVSNVAANELYVLEEEAMWKIGVLVEVCISMQIGNETESKRTWPLVESPWMPAIA
jgi:hypothetical protein